MARPLKIFMRGKNIAALQELLRRMGYVIDDQPRQFGTSTRDAVKSFQRQQALQANGIVDDALLQAMQHTQSGPTSTTTKAEPHHAPIDERVNQQQFDALIRLLINKNIFTQHELQTELQAEMSRPQVLRVSQKPLV